MLLLTQAAVTISAQENVSLINLVITCANSTAGGQGDGFDGVNGRPCIANSGTQTLIKKCTIFSGAGASGQTNNRVLAVLVVMVVMVLITVAMLPVFKTYYNNWRWWCWWCW